MRLPNQGLICPNCGYALDGLPGRVCPECGEWFDPNFVGSTSPDELRRWRRMIVWGSLLLLAATVGLVWLLARQPQLFICAIACPFALFLIVWLRRGIRT